MAISFTFTVSDPAGIHARPASQLVAKAQEFNSAITLRMDDRSVDAKRILGVMGFGAKQGDSIEVSVDGDDETAAAAELERFVKENL